MVPNPAIALQLRSDAAGINLATNKVVRLRGDVTEKAAEQFVSQVTAKKDLPGPLVVVIDSSGGDVAAGKKMIDALDAERKGGTKIVCVVQHRAHSMAFNIFTRCDVRLAVKGSIMLVHKVRQFPGAALTAEQCRSLAEELDAVDEEFRIANTKAMKLSDKDYNLYARNETYWRAESLLKIGYLHGIVSTLKN